MKYDDSNPLSIKEYGELLIGKTFRDVLNCSTISLEEREEAIAKVNNARYKGGMGNFIEKYHFEYEINNNQEPDFPKAGVELKVTPYVQNKNGTYSAGERLVITMISYQNPVEPDLLTSHVYKKFRLMLLVHYLRSKDKKIPRIDYPMNYVTLFTPPEEDMKIIREDYEKIIKKVSEGRAHELSESDTMYLGASTKGSTAEKSTVPQDYYAPHIKAKKRAFCFKTSYMTTILNKYIFNKTNTYESILENLNLSNTEQTFEELIISIINQNIGKTVNQLTTEFDVNIKPTSKDFHSHLTLRMLGVKSDNAEEFVKADIEVKAVRVRKNGTLKESVSFPAFKFKEFATEEWEDSTFYNILSSKHFLFVIYKEVGNEYVLQGCKMWNMNNIDLEEARLGWEANQRVAIEGPIFTKKYKKNGEFTVENNFPKKKDNRVVHIRPHTTRRYYVLGNGEVIGENPAHGDELPDGRIMTKHSFWLNNTYVLEQISDVIK